MLAPLDKAAYRKGPNLGKRALDALMPMHVWIGPTGHILRAGPTLTRLAGPQTLVGQRISEVFEFRRPRQVQAMADLVGHHGQTVYLRFRSEGAEALRGIAMVLPAGQGILLNLTIGIRIGEVVGRHGLDAGDFAASDPSVDMLFLIEAQSAVLSETQSLNARLQSAQQLAADQASTDALTGLRNRRAMASFLDGLLNEAHSKRFGLMHIDLDYFKQVNDTHGHAAGDLVLQNAAEVLGAETRKGDLVARVGGDEFVIIFVDCDDLILLDGIAKRIIERLERPVIYKTAQCCISASIGTTVSTAYDRPDADLVLQDADAALYASKRQGRARHTVFSPEMRLH